MKTDILITDICLPGTGEESPLLENCCIAISGDSIEQIGPAADFGKIEAATTINGRRQLALPGLINAHCHGAMTLFRGLADDLELGQWLNEHIFPAEAANVNPDMVYWCTRLAAAEMIMSGTTTVADGYFHEHDAARAFADAGMRAVAAQGIIDFPAPGVPDPADNINAADAFIDHWQGRNPLVTPAVFAHSPYTCSGATLQAAKELAQEKDVPLFIHAAESRLEPKMITNMQGGSPVRHLDALGILDPDTVCIHCVWVDDEDLDILAERGAGVVVCPQSHLKLASGIAPLESMLSRGIRVGLGTDGPASNNSLDMFQEMDLCAKIQKIRALDPVAVPAAEILKAATRGGAAVIGMQEQTGTLTPGMKADIILIDLDSPHLQPMHGVDLMVYAADAADVQTVVINGNLIMQDRHLLNFDLAETMHRVRLLAGEIHHLQ